ncbi:MAG: methyltransferase, partial [Planctomycetia bacterium]
GAAPRPAVRVTGIDVSPRAVAHATARAADARIADGAEVAFAVRDVVADGCPACDIATSSLFLHHLDDADAIRVLRSLAAAARIGVVVSDLLRSRAGLALAMLGTTVLSSSRVARVDGPLSVRAARTLSEYRDLFDRAGLHGATIRRAWPERAVITWRRDPPGATA